MREKGFSFPAKYESQVPLDKTIPVRERVSAYLVELNKKYTRGGTIFEGAKLDAPSSDVIEDDPFSGSFLSFCPTDEGSSSYKASVFSDEQYIGIEQGDLSLNFTLRGSEARTIVAIKKYEKEVILFPNMWIPTGWDRQPPFEICQRTKRWDGVLVKYREMDDAGNVDFGDGSILIRPRIFMWGQVKNGYYSSAEDTFRWRDNLYGDRPPTAVVDKEANTLIISEGRGKREEEKPYSFTFPLRTNIYDEFREILY